jgi:hypothetical protein
VFVVLQDVFQAVDVSAQFDAEAADLLDYLGDAFFDGDSHAGVFRAEAPERGDY